MNNAFQLHSRLAQDCIVLGDFTLSRLLLMNDSQFPWFILVPRRENISEIYHLSESERALLLKESCYLAEQLVLLYKPDKLNIATIGNKVPQLHVHHIVRYQTDKVWPEPVWGKYPAQAYSTQELSDLIKRLQTHFNSQFIEYRHAE